MHVQPRFHDQPRQRQRMRRPAHILLHQQHAGGRLDIQPARIETHSLADQRHARGAGVAPCQFNQARGMVAAGSPAHRVDHGVVALQDVAARHMQLRLMRLGQLFRLGFKVGRSHIFGGGIHQIANQRHGACFRHGGMQGLGILGQENARADGILVRAVAGKTILSGLPAEQRLPRVAFGQCIGACGQGFRQFGQAPARQRVGAGDTGDSKPAFAIGNDADFTCFAGKRLPFQRGTLRWRQGFVPI